MILEAIIILGKGSQGSPIRPITDYWELLGLIRAYWEDMGPPPQALWWV